MLTVSRDFSNFLSNEEKKVHMSKLLLQTTKERKLHCLHALKTPQMILSHVLLKLIGCSPYIQLFSSHGKTDTKDIFRNGYCPMEALQVKFSQQKVLECLVFSLKFLWRVVHRKPFPKIYCWETFPY